jgi:hypothetical protein
MAAKSAEAQLRKAVIAALKAAGLPVSKDVRVFPRVELTDVQESGAIDKGEDVRELGFVVEAISLSAYEEAATLSDTAETALVGQDTVTMPNFTAVDIYKELGTEIVEVGDADILVIRRRTQYRANVSRK